MSTDIDAAVTAGAAGTGFATLSSRGAVLDVWYPAPDLGRHDRTVTERLASGAGPTGVGETVTVRTTIADLCRPPVDACDVYLRLHLLSHRMIRPRQANLDGIDRLLTDVVWTNRGPIAVEDFPAVHLRLRARGPLTVYGVGKVPRMVDYVVPSGVRVADGARVQLGAHLAPGTTVMPEGFVDYDAGTLGGAIVEGQVAAGVVIGAGSDMGGGTSAAPISIGERCLIGAKAEIEMPIGDDCVVETGLHVAPDTLLTRPGGEAVAAGTIAGLSNLHLRRNSLTGAVEALPWHGAGVDLNAALLAND